MQIVTVACKLPGASCETELGVKQGYAIRAQVCSTLAEEVKITVRDGELSMAGDPVTIWEIGVGTQSSSTTCAALTVPATDITPNPDPSVTTKNDVQITLTGGSAATPTCCTIVFGFEGSSSANVSLKGFIPYEWFATATPAITYSEELIVDVPDTGQCAEKCSP